MQNTFSVLKTSESPGHQEIVQWLTLLPLQVVLMITDVQRIRSGLLTPFCKPGFCNTIHYKKTGRIWLGSVKSNATYSYPAFIKWPQGRDCVPNSKMICNSLQHEIVRECSDKLNLSWKFQTFHIKYSIIVQLKLVDSVLL